MANGIRASKPRGLNKGSGFKFCVGSRVRQETLKRAGGHISWNVIITIKMKTIVQKPWII